MRKILVLILFPMLVVSLLTSCSRKKHLLIEIPKDQKVIIKKEPLVKEELSPLIKKEKRTFYPDPTRGFIENKTYNIFIYVWLDPDFKGKRTGLKTAGLPDITLPPKSLVEIIMPLGSHFVYAEGRINTAEFGWQSVGVANKKIFINFNVRYGGHYGWKVSFQQGDFRR